MKMMNGSGRATGGRMVITLLAVSALAACVVDNDADTEDAAVQTQTPPPAPTPGTTTQTQPQSDMQIEVDLSERRLHVIRGGSRVESHPVAVGTQEWPTPTGEWTIGQVVFNPRWVPPEEEWAEGEEIAEPGAPDNPLGVAQLVYRPPNSIHGTTDTASLGKAASHGSIRVSNDVVMKLARQIMESGGAARDSAFFQRVRSNRTERVDVNIPNPVPIRVVQ